MKFLAKASLSKKVRQDYIIRIALVGSVSLAGLVLAVYSLLEGSYLFAVWYLAAFILGSSYVVIRINAAFPTYIGANEEYVVLSSWKNGVLPYTMPEKPTLISDFIPEKITTVQIQMNDVATVIVGSKKFLAKHLSEEEFPEILTRLSENPHFENALKRMDFIFVRTKYDDSCFMSVADFDVKELFEFVGIIEKHCNGVQILTNIPKLVKMRSKLTNTIQKN